MQWNIVDVQLSNHVVGERGRIVPKPTRRQKIEWQFYKIVHSRIVFTQVQWMWMFMMFFHSCQLSSGIVDVWNVVLLQLGGGGCSQLFDSLNKILWGKWWNCFWSTMLQWTRLTGLVNPLFMYVAIVTNQMKRYWLDWYTLKRTLIYRIWMDTRHCIT